MQIQDVIPLKARFQDHLLLLDTSGHCWALGDPLAAGLAGNEELGMPKASQLTRPTPLNVLWGATWPELIE